MNDASTYTERLRRLVPLTPSGLAAYARAGWRAIVAELLQAVKSLPADDLARLAALAVFLAEERKARKGH